MSEMGDDFRALRDLRRESNRKNRVRVESQIWPLQAEGFKILELTPYQFRINDRLDIYTTRERWHDLRTGKRGTFIGKDVAQYIRRFFGVVSPANK